MTISPLHPSTPALAASLIDDPFYQALTVDFAHDASVRRRVLEQYMDYAVREAKHGGLCQTPEDPSQGMAIWSLPRSVDQEQANAVAKQKYLQTLLGTRGMDSYLRIIDFMSPRTSRAELEGAWYLSILGVDPYSQGQGIGAKLLTPTLASADKVGATCYLETFSSRNEGFYGRLGFITLATHLEPVTNAPYKIMVRKASRE